MIPIPDITTLIHYLTNNSGTWISAFLPWVGILLGISIALLIGKAILNWIEDKLDGNKETDFL